MNKVLVIAAAQNFTFIKDIAQKLGRDSDLEVTFWTGPTTTYTGNRNYDSPEMQYRQNLHAEINAADVVWLEWADGLPIQVLKAYDAKFILRIHRYELFQQRTIDALRTVDPSKISQLLFVSPYVKRIGVSKFPWMKEGVVIPNLIDTSKWQFRERQKGGNILFLGRMSYVKNLPMMLNYFYELHYYFFDRSPIDFQLHIVGDISDPELQHYYENFIEKSWIGDQISYHGRVDHDELRKLMKSMHYIACTSIFESQGVGILEGMASGLKPVIYSFPSAEFFFPDRYLFLDRNQFLSHFDSSNLTYGHYRPIEYRSFVDVNFSTNGNLWKYREVIDKCLNI